MSRKIKDADYLCLSAILRAKEAKLLTRSELDRMLSEPNFSDACRIAEESGVGDMSGMNVKQVNDTLASFRAAELEEIAEIIPDPGVLDLFRMTYACHNAKVIVKSRGNLDSSADMLSDSGGVDVQEMLKIYADEEAPANGISVDLAFAIREAKQALARTDNPMLADFILDKACYSHQLKAAKSFKKPYITEFVRSRIDKANLRSAMRTQGMDKRGELLKYALIEGGTIEIEEILRSMDTRDDLIKLYSSTIYKKAAEAADMTEFEKLADNAEKDNILSASFIAFGPEVVLEYCSALESEITSMRIILTGKLMGIGSEKLRERLRDSYV